MLGARREHAVRLEAALRDQVVHEDADVGLVALQFEPSFATSVFLAALMPAMMPCAAAFFVAGCAVNLTCEEQARHALGFKPARQPVG